MNKSLGGGGDVPSRERIAEHKACPHEVLVSNLHHYHPQARRKRAQESLDLCDPGCGWG